ncbi:clathrin adaptor appendage domain-containing protein [Ramicandelaber brevisporus]|nr:clathrin adaptor appendage domain-containing protein [Ramicandelaber brevisporus]
MTAKIFAAAAQYAPSRRWHIDTLVRTLQLAGAHASDEDLNGFLLLVANEPDHQAYVVRRLYVSLGSTEALAQEGLVIAALWCIGEYGELLLQAAPHGSGDDAAMAAPITSVQVVTLVRTAMKSAFANANVRQYGLTAAAKLTTRFVDTAAQTLLQRLVAEYATSIDVELQQRAVEFAKLGTTEFVGLRAGLLERMPAPEYKGPDQVASILNPAARARAHLPRNTADADAVEVPSAKPGAAASTAAARSDMDLLIDLMSDDAAPPSTPAAPASGSSPSSGGGSGGGQTSINSLLDLLGGASISSSSAAAAATAAGSPPAAASASVAEKSIYSKHGLSVTLRKLSTSSADQASITAVFQNTGDSFLSDILLQVAVPRSMKLQLHPATANALPAGSGTASQGMSISHPPNAAIRLRIKLAFSVDGQNHDELINFDGF